MDFTKLFDLQYLTDKHPATDTNMVLFMSIFFVLVVLTGLLMQISVELHVVSPVWRSFLRKIPGNLYIFSLFGFLLVFARYEGSPLLSMRLLLVLLIIGLITYIAYKAYYIHKEYPRRLKAQKKK